MLANNVTVVSDGTLKRDIEPLGAALELVNALRPVSYGWKDTDRFGDRREVGLIAQEVERVVPSVVHGGGDRAYSLEYAKLVPVLVKAVQELAARNETLAAENDALAARVAHLEG